MRPLVLSLLLTATPVFAEEVKLGAILILTGEGATYGVNSQRGIELAKEELNAAGGINGKALSLIYEDEAGGRADKAVSAFKKLVSVDHVKFIIGPNWTDASRALGPLAEREGVIMIAPSALATPPNIFTKWPKIEPEVDALVERVLKRASKISILSAQTTWESAVAARFKQTAESRGATIVSFDEPLADTADVKTEIVKVRAAQPQAIFISSYLLFPKYLKELARAGVKAPIFGIELDQALVNATDGLSEGIEYIGPAPAPHGFIDRFKSRFNTTPDVSAVQAYDAVKLLAKTMVECGTEPSAVRTFLQTALLRPEPTAFYRVERGVIRQSTAD